MRYKCRSCASNFEKDIIIIAVCTQVNISTLLHYFLQKMASRQKITYLTFAVLKLNKKIVTGMMFKRCSV